MSSANPITTTAATIAAQLGETAPGARATIWRTVRTSGSERVQAFVKEAQEVEANGSMLLPDGSHTRTLGGSLPPPSPPLHRHRRVPPSSMVSPLKKHRGQHSAWG